MEQVKSKDLNELISDSGLKLDYIADKMGISRQRLYEIRKNPNTMGIDQMGMLAEILDVEVMEIYNVYKKFSFKVDKNATSIEE